MKTPIYDFVNGYILKDPVRMHMPGHKGRSPLIGKKEFSDIYKYDITEIDGADYLSAPCGIIAESEKNAGKLFGTDTFYSTEGSSLCIRAMLFMIVKKAEQEGKRPFILAGRNAHSTFVNACALLDIDVDWIMPLKSESYESCSISAPDLEDYIRKTGDTGIKPDALYVTSPDYLGNMLDIRELATVCHKNGMLLLVDNAHGAYLKFLEKSLFPIDLGADMCCSSAHKTLPVLTGGAYLHINNGTDRFFYENARQVLSLFASTSPSYLILQSLDLCNEYLEKASGDENMFVKAAERVSTLKRHLSKMGYELEGDEPLKISVRLRYHGCCAAGRNKKSEWGSDRHDGMDGLEIADSKEIDGNSLANVLKQENIYVEYHDRSHIVFMFTPLITDDDIKGLEDVMLRYSKEINSYTQDDCTGRENATNTGDVIHTERLPKPVKAMSMKEAMMSVSETVDVKNSIGRIMAYPVLSCPPCVPVYMYGEVIGEDILNYSDGKIRVVKI